MEQEVEHDVNLGGLDPLAGNRHRGCSYSRGLGSARPKLEGSSQELTRLEPDWPSLDEEVYKQSDDIL